MIELFASKLETLNAVAIATIDVDGMLIDANSGFLRLINKPKPNTERVDHFFIQPTYATLINTQPGVEGEIYHGLLTIGEYTGQTRSLQTHVWREANQLCVLAEYDVESLERINDTVLQLNRDYAKAQFEITQMNLKLKRREVELEQSLAQLEAANLRLKTTQRQLVEAEKMASLGILVAGVAHEINTPLGVSLGSASLLEQQSQSLAQNFAERRMTHSELDGFLNKALLETQLIHTNLKRIGHITKSFHQLAVSDQASTKARFNFNRCIDDVLTSLDRPLRTRHVVVHNHCDKGLEIEGFLTDWASIFINLITNSLQHGFKGRNDGTIEIKVTTQAEKLVVDYDDDGVGLSSEVQARIFDPFFTTDMQHGMGLGMHLIYNLISQKLNGSITCGNPSQGTHFHIEARL